jgi:uncharacterized protein (DUF58 family)
VTAPPTAASAAPEPGRFDEAFVRKLERLALVSKRVARGLAHGERRTRRSGAGLEFADHRAYTPGDDLRRLDWNLYGRLERPLVRLFEEDEELPLHLLVDTSASMGFGAPTKLRLAIEIAAALAYVGLANLERVAVHALDRTLGESLGLQRGKAHVQPVFAFLTALRARGRTDLRAAIDRFVTRHGRRGIAVLLSDCFDPAGSEQAIDRLRASRFLPVIVQITAPEEHAPELDQDVLVVDAETELERTLTVTPAVRAAYQQRFAERQAALARACRRQGVPCFQPRSDQPFEEVVLRLFREGGLLR